MTTTTSAMITRGTIADSAATVAAFAMQHIGAHGKPGWYIIFADDEHRLWEPPQLIRDRPIKPEGGRVGSGLTRCVSCAVSRHVQLRLGASYYTVLHFLGDGPHRVDAVDLESVRRWTRLDGYRTNDIEVETPEAWISRWALSDPWILHFFEDLLCLWQDGTFESVRDALALETAGKAVPT